MLKKMTVLAMAVGVVAALALPTSASANWKHHNTNIAQTVQLGLTGNVKFQGAIGGVECQITSQATFEPGTTGVVDTFKAHPTDDTTNCKGISGLAPCQIHNLFPQVSPDVNWQFHTSAFQTINSIEKTQNGLFHTKTGVTHPTAVVVTPGTIQSQLTGGIFCLVKKVQLHPGPIGIMEENPPNQTYADQNTVTNADVNGSAIATIETNSGAIDTEETLVQGTLQVEVPNQNTYSL